MFGCCRHHSKSFAGRRHAVKCLEFYASYLNHFSNFRPNVEKKVSFQEDFLKKSDEISDENNRGRLHLAPLPSKTSSHHSKSRKSSKSTDDESAENKRHSRQSNHKHSNSRKPSQGKKDQIDNEEKRKKSRAPSKNKEQESYM